jgi:hypothetical protein
MSILKRFAPPANLSDLDSIPGGLELWHELVCERFDISINGDSPRVTTGPFQFYNPARFDPGGLVIEQAVTWNAFPKELIRRFGRKRALEEADELWTLDRYYSVLCNRRVDRRRYPKLFRTSFRPQHEYCEWRVERDRNTKAIRRVTFTSEPPEFWEVYFQLKNGPNAMLKQYKKFVGPGVRLKDLIAPRDIEAPGRIHLAIKGQYNIYNKWNTTHGIVHLCAPPNSLSAEIQLGADASILRRNSTDRLLVEPEALICCAGYGGPNRNSDPTIGAAVNAASRLGAFVTLKDPVGLYMDHIDLSGWELPDGKGVADCIDIVRGAPGMIERLVVEVPKRRRRTVSDITIGGEPIRYGGQIAECITVKLITVVNLPKQPVRNDPIQCSKRCVFKRGDPPSMVQLEEFGGLRGRTFTAAFSSEGMGELCAAGKKLTMHDNTAGRLRLRRRMP